MASGLCLALRGIVGPCQRSDGVRVRRSRLYAQSLGLKGPKDSWALQNPEVGSYSPAEVLEGCLPPRTHAMLCVLTQGPFLA